MGKHSKIGKCAGCFIAILLFVGCSTLRIAPPNHEPPLAHGQTVDLGGVFVNYTSSATNPEDVTLVLIHGFGASLETWHDVYPALSAQVPVIRLDLKGHGFSSKPKDDAYTLVEQATLVTAFITRLGLKRVILVGHSLGGAVALLTCLQRQDQKAPFDIVGLILIDSAGYPQKLPLFVKVLRNPLTRLFSHFMSPEYRARLLLERIFFVKSRVTPDRVYRYAYFFDLPGSRNAVKKTARNIIPPDADRLVKRFQEISIPTLVIWGAEDHVIPVENARRFHHDLKNARLTILPQTGHVPQEERPERVLLEINEFLKAVNKTPHPLK